MGSFLSRGAGSAFGGKKISTYSLILLFLISFLHPGGSVFASAVPAAVGAVNYPVPQSAQVLVKVIAAAPAAIITPATTQVLAQATAPSCLMSSAAATAGNLVQEPGSINFNQPAGCFALQLSRTTVPALDLAVKPLAQALPKINILANNPIVSMPDFSGAPLAQTNPILPLAVFVLLACGVFFKRRVLKPEILPSNFVLRPNLTLEQLQMLRC